MKITSIELHPENSSDVAVFSFRDPRSTNPYNVKAIAGLDAEEIVSRYYGASYGQKFYNLSLEKRELIFKIGLNPRVGELESYSDLRDALYRMIASSRTGQIEIQFKNGSTVVAVTYGSISKLESPLTEKMQEVFITIKPREPMLKAPTPVIVPTAGLSLGNAVITDELSTAPHGFKLALNITVPIPSISIGPSGDSWSFEIIPVGGFFAADVLYFSSEYNDKYLYIMRSGGKIHLADAVVPGSIWPILFPGENTFVINPSANMAWSSITYYPTYWGV
jgi:hypothetical protein